MIKLLALVTIGLITAGCVTEPAVISSINDSSLEVQTGLGTTDAMILAEARRGCGLYDKRPVQISYRCRDEYCLSKAVLFACK